MRMRKLWAWLGRIGRRSASYTVFIAVALGFAGVLSLWSQSALAAKRPYLTYPQFRSDTFTMTLPRVPETMVRVPNTARLLTVDGIEAWPTGLFRSIAPDFVTGSNRGLSRPTLDKHLAILGKLGPAQVYAIPHALATYWMFGQSLQQPTSLVPVSWVSFLYRMEQVHRPYRTTRGPFETLARLPDVVPDFNAWSVAVYTRPLTEPARAYLSAIYLVAHRNRLWVFFSGEPKDPLPPFSRVPKVLVPAPKDAVAAPASEAWSIVARDFSSLFLRSGLRNDAAVRVYHGSAAAMRAWVRSDWKRLDSTAYGYDGAGTAYAGPSLHQQSGVLWGELQLGLSPKSVPQAGIFLMADRQGWAVVAAGPNLSH